MTRGVASLLAGRRNTPLSPDDVRRVVNTFLGFDREANVRYEDGARTVFRVSVSEDGSEVGEIVFGPDIYPGQSVTDPNAALGLRAAAAHELAHFYRWWDKRELPIGELDHLDEALTSLEAIARYETSLSPQDVRQLVSDAVQRIVLFVQERSKSGGSGT